MITFIVCYFLIGTLTTIAFDRYDIMRDPKGRRHDVFDLSMACLVWPIIFLVAVVIGAGQAFGTAVMWITRR